MKAEQNGYKLKLNGTTGQLILICRPNTQPFCDKEQETCMMPLRLVNFKPDQATLEGSSCTSIMTCTGGYGYSF